LPVAGKQNQTTHQRMLEALAVYFGQAGTGDIDNQRCVLGHGSTL
jgi:hypothetical protein